MMSQQGESGCVGLDVCTYLTITQRELAHLRSEVKYLVLFHNDGQSVVPCRSDLFQFHLVTSLNRQSDTKY